MIAGGTTITDCAFRYTIDYSGSNAEGCSGYDESTRIYYCGEDTADGQTTIATITVKSPTGESFGDLDGQTYA